VPHAREPASFGNVNRFACLSAYWESGAVVRDDRGGCGVYRVNEFLRREDAEA
jgi:hypothetical protein